MIEVTQTDEYVIDGKEYKADLFEEGGKYFYAKNFPTKTPRVNFKKPTDFIKALEKAFGINPNKPEDEQAGELIKKMVLIRESDVKDRAKSTFGEIPDGASMKLVTTKIADRTPAKMREMLLSNNGQRRIKEAINAAGVIFPFKKKDKEGRDYDEEQKLETRRDFDKDDKIKAWYDNENIGIGGKAKKSRDQFASRLYKAMRLMNINSGEHFKSAEGADDKVEWLANRMKAVKDFSEKKWAWDPTAKDGEGDFVSKPKQWMEGGESTYYSFVMPVRSFASYVWGGLPKIKRKTHLLAGHVRRHGKHSDVRASPNQIKQIIKCAKEIYENTGNMDPYMYILLGLQTGMRKMEAITIPFEYVSKFKTGYKVKLYNRKTQHALGITGGAVAADSEAFHIAIIDESSLVDLITKRMTDEKYKKKQLLIGSTNPKDPDNYIKGNAEQSVMDVVKSSGILKEISDAQTKLKNNLITPLRTCYESATPDEYKGQEYPKLIEKDESMVKVREAKFIVDDEGNQKLDKFGMPEFKLEFKKDKDGNIIEVPKYETGLNENQYFYKKPLHAVRHMFAQLWLDDTDWNYGLVAKVGHWKTIKELEDSYGEKPESIFVKEFAGASQAVASSIGGSSTLSDDELKEGAKEIVTTDAKEKELEEIVEEAKDDLDEDAKKKLNAELAKDGIDKE